jgi:hypothetical protein
MANGKKYDFKLTQETSTWKAEIVRQVTSKRTAVSKSQDGFATQEEAQTWAETELKTFLAAQAERNKRKKAAKKPA